MRLSDLEVSQMHQAIQGVLGSKSYELFLYGSRLEDSLKGGDIDLVLVCSDAENIQPFYFKILSEIKQKMGYQKIDLSLASQSQLKSDPFLSLLFNSKKVVKL